MPDDSIPAILCKGERLRLIEPVETVEDAVINGLNQANFQCFGFHMTVEIVKRHMDKFLKEMDKTNGSR